MADSISRAVLITGCSTGIGRATAQRLASNGWTVYASARKLSDIKDLADHGCKIIDLDVCSEESMQKAVALIEREQGAIGVLINNAGYGQEGPVEEIPMNVVRKQFDTNVFGLIRLCQLALPSMRRQRWGKIVNLSSMGGRLTFPGGGFYHATKYAVEALSDALRFEVRPFGIDVIVVEPGPIKTRFGDTAVESVSSAATDASDASPYAGFKAVLAEQIRNAYEGPMGRFAAPPDAVAKVIEKALRAGRPRTRYPVTFAARFLMALRRWLPDRAFDAFLATQFRIPTPN